MVGMNVLIPESAVGSWAEAVINKYKHPGGLGVAAEELWRLSIRKGFNQRKKG